MENVKLQKVIDRLAKDPNNFWTLVGRYVYNLVRTQVGWKIRGCVISVYWTETDTESSF